MTRLALREGYGPTLPELLSQRGLSKRVRVALYVAVAALVLLLAYLYSARDHVAGDRTHIQREGLAWNVRFAPVLKEVAPKDGETFRIERRTDSGLFLQAFSVTPIELPGEPGEPGGLLAAQVDPLIERLRSRYAEFELVSEGKSRVNQALAYSISFQARLGKRRLFGRAVVVPEQIRAPKRAQLLLIEATPAAGVSNVSEVGSRGVTKRPFRSFRLGTDPGGVATGLEAPPPPDPAAD